uniref:C2H2-type domain-containing protein n=1 Tax=Panagrellus redivivus TaxID=6233 RepID=A0A7E4ZZV7_PANRE
MDLNSLNTSGQIRDNPVPETPQIICQYCGVAFPQRDAFVLLNHLQIVHSDVNFEQFRTTVLGIAMDLRSGSHAVNYNLNDPCIRNAVDQVLGTNGNSQGGANAEKDLDESEDTASTSRLSTVSVTTTDTSNFYRISGSTTSPNGDKSTFTARIDKKWINVGHFTDHKQIDAARVSRGAAPTATYKEKKGIVKRYYKCKNCKYYMMSWQNRVEGALYEWGKHEESCTIIADMLNPPSKDQAENAIPELFTKDIENYADAIVKAGPLNGYSLCCLHQIAFEFGVVFVIENAEDGTFLLQRDAEFLKFGVENDEINVLRYGEDGSEECDSWPGTRWGYYLAAIRKKCAIVFGGY